VRVSALSIGSVDSEMKALRASGPGTADVAETVARILADVKARGDAAVVEATAKFDWPRASAESLAVPAEELEAAYRELDPKLHAALDMSFKNSMSFHRREMTPGWEVMGFQWQNLGVRHLPVARAGLYVPGGLGSYASTVIMNACPVLVAGVGEMFICTPPGIDGSVNKSVLAAARLVGINRVFRVGGAQAVAAMAYGTETIPRAEVICGPGNAYVAEAKRQVYGAVGIDSFAGPSEVLILADAAARVEGAVTVLRARALRELANSGGSHGAATPEAVAEADSRMTAFFSTPGEDFLALCEAAVDAYAPEHLELQLANAREFLPRVRSAGAVFVGGLSATAFGDYIAGSNHVLPTGGSARFSSPLTVQTFMRSSTHVEMTERAVELLTPHLVEIADSEGFYFHRLSAQLRLERK
jgi:histidinol dehydrogenase